MGDREETAGTLGSGAVPPAGRREVELKLSLQPDQVDRFRRNALLRSLAVDRPQTRRLRTTYYDTPDLALRSRGIALRVRDDGERRRQTVKFPEGARPGVQAYREIETDVDGPGPDLGRLARRKAGAFLSMQGRPRLDAVFVSDLRRRVVGVHLEDSDIEVALDVGEIRAEGRSVPVCEAELELKSGRPERLFELALALHERVPMRLERRTKAARGYRLLTGDRPVPGRPRPVELHPAQATHEAFPSLAWNCLAHIRANEEAVRDGAHPEAVHEMRIGVRRLRALVGIFRDLIAPNAHAYLAAELRWLQQELGPARDWDVFIGETLDPLAARLGGRGMEPLRAAAEAARAAAYQRAKAALDQARYTTFVLRADLWLGDGLWANRTEQGAALELPLKAFADRALARLDQRLRKLGRKHRGLSEPELHRLRIRAKKLRYTADFFRELYKPKAASALLAALKQIQDSLGALNDAVVARGFAAELERRLTEADADRAAAIHARRGRRLERRRGRPRRQAVPARLARLSAAQAAVITVSAVLSGGRSGRAARRLRRRRPSARPRAR